MFATFGSKLRAANDKMACEEECVCVEWSLICEPFSRSEFRSRSNPRRLRCVFPCMTLGKNWSDSQMWRVVSIRSLVT